MKKLYVILYIMVILIPIAFAVEGNISVYSVRMFVDSSDELNRDIEWEEMEVYTEPGKTMQLQIRLENEESFDVEVNMEGIIYGIGNDLEKSKKETIEIGDKRYFVLEYFIPNDISQTIYDFDVEYSYSYNGTDYKHKNDYQLYIVEDKIDEFDVLVNLTRSLSEEQKVREQLLLNIGVLNTTLKNMDFCGTTTNFTNLLTQQYDVKSDEVSELKSNLSTCITEKNNMYTQGYVQSREEIKYNEGEKEGKESQKLNFFFGAGLVGLIWFWKNKQGKVGDEKKNDPIVW